MLTFSIQTFHSFLFEKRGAAMPIIAFSIFVLLMAAGGAIDAGRAQLVEAKLSSSLDAAGLAAGSSVSTANYQDEIDKYFYANFPDGYQGATITSLDSNLSADGTVISLSATATIPTMLLKVLGINEFTISAESEITRQSNGLELVLVIDNSGSMDFSAGGGKTRLEAAQDAIEILLDILYGADNDERENLWVGMVPFSQAVNIGIEHSNWANSEPHSFSPTSWDGCVEARASTGRDITDDTYKVEKFEKYWYPCSSPYNNWYGTDSYEKNCHSGKNNKKDYRAGISNTTWGPNLYCPQRLTELTAKKSNVLDDVETMVAIGSTHTNLGVVWGWRLISPKWNKLWKAEMTAAKLPLDYNTPNMDKAVIILSDGDNQHVDYNYSAYGYLSEGRIGTTNTNWADNYLDDKTEDVCDAMKDNNIIIYTIAFGTSISTQGKNLMKACASKSDYYFESPDSDDLAAAFKTIGDSLASLRVSK